LKGQRAGGRTWSLHRNCVAAASISLICFGLAATAQNQPPAPVTINRTVPQVTPPKKELECSANPTRDEILRARVFKEPLVQIGGEPSAEENAALAAALLGYAKRSGPDDFASLTSFLEQHPKTV
jgi:hypothetical protein